MPTCACTAGKAPLRTVFAQWVIHLVFTKAADLTMGSTGSSLQSMAPLFPHHLSKLSGTSWEASHSYVPISDILGTDANIHALEEM